MKRKSAPPTTYAPLPENRNPTLEDAWGLFAKYDLNAEYTQERFRSLRKWIMTLSIAATTLAIINESLFEEPSSTLRYLIVIITLSVTGLLTISRRFERGVNWVLLRGSAETIKTEIYRFRTKTGSYSPEETKKETREIKLARKIKLINEWLMKSEVSQVGLKVYKGETLPPPIQLSDTGDDGFSPLSPKQYEQFRLKNQLNWYKRKTVQLDQRVRLLRYLVIGFGGVSTFLTFFGLEVWIAITTALVAAFTSYIEFNQLESRIMIYNQASTDLESILIWWRAQPEPVRKLQKSFEILVKTTEDVLQAESSRWLRTMQEALQDLDPGEQASSLRTTTPIEPIPLGEATPKKDPLFDFSDTQDWDEVFPAAFEPATAQPATPEVPEWDLPSDEDIPEPMDLSPEDLAALDKLLANDVNEEAPSSTEISDSDLPFGDTDFSDDDVAVDDFVARDLPPE